MNQSKEQLAPPDVILKLIEGFQYDTNVEVPGPHGETYVFSIGVLWDDEVRALQRAIGYKVSANDFVSRELETRFETVLRSVISISYPASSDPVWNVIVPDDDEATRFCRKELRYILGKLPRTVELLYQEYQKLVTVRDQAFDAELERIKKSSREPSLPEKLKENLESTQGSS